MARSRSLVPVATAVVILTSGSILGAGQIPLSPVRDAGQTVTPAYEGWYPNPDGTFTLSFGYYNRNREEIVGIPLGQDNFISPGPSNQGQPTRLHPRRHWGVFTVAPVLPAGTVLKVTAWHDNRASNRHNPDPTQWVGWGDRTVDEMAHVWVDVTYLEEDDYERLSAERRARESNDDNQ